MLYRGARAFATARHFVASVSLFALMAFALRNKREKRKGPGPLEEFATLIAICGSLAGLAAQFVPGVGVKERPSREIAMAIRDIKTRITRGEYLTRMTSRPRSAD
jgi:hypothetical protein